MTYDTQCLCTACTYNQYVYMIKTKVTFLEGRPFSSQPGFLKTFQIVLIGWRPSKKATFVLIV